jgi:hypothetical protein
VHAVLDPLRGDGDVGGHVLGPADVVGQRALGVLEGRDRARGQVVQLDAAAGPAQRALHAEDVDRQRR